MSKASEFIDDFLGNLARKLQITLLQPSNERSILRLRKFLQQSYQAPNTIQADTQVKFFWLGDSDQVSELELLIQSDREAANNARIK